MAGARIMPLLSTLAALVILAHSAEEEQHRHEISPRLSEPGAPDYDQSWRAVEQQPAMQQRSQDEEWGVEISPLEPLEPPAPRRRRPGRKRRRRPQHDAADQAPAEQTPYYADGRGLDQDAERAPPDAVEPLRRRRKRPDDASPARREGEPHDQRRPLRRRGHRRKQRPLTPDAEQNDRVRIQEDIPTSPQEHRPEPEQTHRDEDTNHDERYDKEREELHPDEHIDTDSRAPHASEHVDTDTRAQNPSEHTGSEGNLYLEDMNRDQITMDDLISEPKDKIVSNEENSESDMSVVEISVPVHMDVQEKPKEEAANEGKRDKSYRVPYSLARKQEQSSDGTSKIKELLKQSGGLSLSEILQQRNLSLSDLLNGKQNAISALKSDTRVIPEEDSFREGSGSNQKIDHIHTEEKHNEVESSKNPVAQDHSATAIPDLSIKPLVRRLPPLKNYKTKGDIHIEVDSLYTDGHSTETPRRRLPPSGARRNMRQRIRILSPETTLERLRPHHNFLSLHPRRRENTTMEPTHETENLIDTENVNITTNKTEEYQTTTKNNDFTTTTEEITTTVSTSTYIDQSSDRPKESTENPEISNMNSDYNAIVKPKLIIPALRPKLLATNSELRRQALSNRQRKKKLRQKATINAEEIPVTDLFGMANLVSASEFITKIQSTQQPTSTTTENDLPDLFTDFSTNIEAEKVVTEKVEEKIDNEPARHLEIKNTKYTPIRQRVSVTTIRNISPTVTTEEGAKEEILEVFKDVHGGARLAKILSERNMTINELVQHRERGSSQIHLADIFHNASREPNPPEPFLSKSLIEPISKETYPLRALLEANSHEPPVPKIAKLSPYAAQFTNIPLIVDYGRNINENGENLGILALFNEFSNNKIKYDKNIKKDSEGTAYFTSVMSLNSTGDNYREGKAMVDAKKEPEVMPSIETNVQNTDQKSEKTETISTTKGTTITTAKPYGERDVDGDGLIILEDLQHFNVLENGIAQAINEKLEVNMVDNAHRSDEHQGFLAKFPSSVRSATIASASIVGLSIIVFLLTYVGCKWRRHRKNLLRKDSFRGERIPTPVFENRKSNRNCSSRSISPMLASSNGFTMSTLDSQAGKESPDYMWDTLHKPFQ